MWLLACILFCRTRLGTTKERVGIKVHICLCVCVLKMGDARTYSNADRNFRKIGKAEGAGGRFGETWSKFPEGQWT